MRDPIRNLEFLFRCETDNARGLWKAGDVIGYVPGPAPDGLVVLDGPSYPDDYFSYLWNDLKKGAVVALWKSPRAPADLDAQGREPDEASSHEGAIQELLGSLRS